MDKALIYANSLAIQALIKTHSDPEAFYKNFRQAADTFCGSLDARGNADFARLVRSRVVELLELMVLDLPPNDQPPQGGFDKDEHRRE